MQPNILLGAGSAKADIEHGRGVLSLEERRRYAERIWPPGQEPHRDPITGARGHYGSGICRGVFWDWSKLRAEWVYNYTAVVEAEQKEADSWSCRH